MAGGFSAGLAGLSAAYPGFVQGQGEEIDLADKKAGATALAASNFVAQLLGGSSLGMPSPQPPPPGQASQPAPQGPPSGHPQGGPPAGPIPGSTGGPPMGGPSPGMINPRQVQGQPQNLTGPMIRPGGNGPMPGAGPMPQQQPPMSGPPPGMGAGARPPGGGGASPGGPINLQSLMGAYQQAARMHPELNQPGVFLKTMQQFAPLLQIADREQLMQVREQQLQQRERDLIFQEQQKNYRFEEGDDTKRRGQDLGADKAAQSDSTKRRDQDTRMAIAQLSDATKREIADKLEGGRNSRAELSANARMEIAMLGDAGRTLRTQLQQEGQTTRTGMREAGQTERAELSAATKTELARMSDDTKRKIAENVEAGKDWRTGFTATNREDLLKMNIQARKELTQYMEGEKNARTATGLAMNIGSKEREGQLNRDAAQKRAETSAAASGARQEKGIAAADERATANRTLREKLLERQAENQILRDPEIQASKSALTQMEKQQAAVNSFEQNERKNGEVLVQLAKKVDKTGIPIVEKWRRWVQGKGPNDADVNEFNLQYQNFVTGAARIITNPNMTGVLSNKAREEIQAGFPQWQTVKSIEQSMNRIFADFDNRKAGIEREVGRLKSDIDKRTKALGGKGTPAAAGSGGWSIEEVK